MDQKLNKNQKLERDFFQRPTCLVAQELLGKILNFKGSQVLINETEAYLGLDDPASHAYRGKTKRTAVMFGEAGFSYVYLIYGMYHCLNVVTESIDIPGAVLIRGGVLLNNNLNPFNLKGPLNSPLNSPLNGPGKLCRALEIKLEHGQIDLTQSDDFYFSDIGLKPDFKTSPRIGISKAIDKEWRFYM